MTATASSANTPQDPREFASRKVLTEFGVPAEGVEPIGVCYDLAR